MESHPHLRIMVLDWNADGLRMCETMSQKKADDDRKGYKGYFTKRYPCVAPDFLDQVRHLITENKPHVVVIGTQEEANEGTFMHSDLLPGRMPEWGYTFLKRDKLNNVGEIPSKLPLGRKDVSNSAIRISIYVENNVANEFIVNEKQLDRLFGGDGQVDLRCQVGDRRSGAIASYIWHRNYGHFAFICVHLPSGSSLLNVGKDINYDTYREGIKAINKLCLINIMGRLVEDLAKGIRPEFIILFGDLNYELRVENKKPLEVMNEIANNTNIRKYRELYEKNDELRKVLSETPLTGFNEGKDNQGPMFMPTWPLARGRPKECIPSSSKERLDVPIDKCFVSPRYVQSMPSWRDRILYKKIGDTPYTIRCGYYDRFDVGHTAESTHAGVIGIFDIVT